MITVLHTNTVFESNCHPWRVTISIPENPVFFNKEYSTHIECLPTDAPAYKVSGHYDMNLSDAVVSMHSRYKGLSGK